MKQKIDTENAITQIHKIKRNQKPEMMIKLKLIKLQSKTSKKRNLRRNKFMILKRKNLI